MSKPLSVQDVIRQSATDVGIDELSRRGCRKVKVLDKQTVFRLIDEAVNRVVEERLAAATAQEREQIRAEARSEFQRLVKERQEQLEERVQREVSAATEEARAHADQQVQEYQERLAQLESQVGQEVEEGRVPGASAIDPELLGSMIREAVAQAAPTSTGPSADLAALQQSIEALSRKVSAGGPGGSSSSSSIEPPSEEALQAFFSRSSSSEQVESNISNVEVKNAKANGVNKNLAKLRSLKQGSE
jgi:hypothetical protein